MLLKRIEFKSFGIFGTVSDDVGENVFMSLEHAYLQPDNSYAPKIPNGEFECVRGMHQLQGMDHLFETFEITGVPNHTRLLFHSGNTDRDSAGCVLLGLARNEFEVLQSRDAFKKFMELLEGIDSFKLTVS